MEKGSLFLFGGCVCVCLGFLCLFHIGGARILLQPQEQFPCLRQRLQRAHEPWCDSPYQISSGDRRQAAVGTRLEAIFSHGLFTRYNYPGRVLMA